ncbi:MAG: hypothetical protein JW973_02395 [Bacteroidales bacterium]|nr:hypothetical protein [Bacteroidales bacterium]
MKTRFKALWIISGIIIFLICLFVIADRIFYNHFVRQSKTIREQNKHPNAGIVKEESLTGLPGPVARYLRYSGIVGKKKINVVRLIHSGSFRPAADMDFFPIKGEYYLTADRPSFCWYGKISIAPGFTIAAFDSYHNGKGRMLVKMMSVFKVADEHSEKTDQSSFGRMVAEMTGIPTFFLDTARIQWINYDSTHAICIVRDSGMQTTAQFFFNTDGSLEKVLVERYYGKDEKSSTLEKFTGIVHGSHNHGGLVLPEVFDGYWNLKEGDLHYVHFVIDSVEWE